MENVSIKMTGSHLHLKKVPDETETIFTFCLCEELSTWLKYFPPLRMSRHPLKI